MKTISHTKDISDSYPFTRKMKVLDSLSINSEVKTKAMDN